MKTALILHGTLGSPEGNWFRWLQSQLEAKGLQVFLPELPNPGMPSLQEWADVIWANCPFIINRDTLIVGHSSGAILSLIVAQQSPQIVGSVVGVSVFYDNSLRWEPNSRLFDVDFDWPAIRQNVEKLILIHSDNDPYVPVEQANYVAKNCGIGLEVISGQGHFNLEHSEEYRQFPKLIEILEREVL